jgi:hypothetical protein
MKLIYVVSMFIIILIALITPRKEYFNITEPCYKNIGNKNSNGSQTTFTNLILDSVLSKDDQIVKGDSYGDEITKNLREFNQKKKLALNELVDNEEAVKSVGNANSTFFTDKEAAIDQMGSNIMNKKKSVDNKLNNYRSNITKFVNDKIMEDGQRKLDFTVNTYIQDNIKNVSVDLSKLDNNNPKYSFNPLNILKDKFNSFTIDNNKDYKKIDDKKSVVPVRLLRPNGCYSQQDFNAILKWSPDMNECNNYNIPLPDYWKTHWNSFTVISTVNPGGYLPFATLNGQNVWHLKTFKDKLEAQDFLNSFNRTVFDWNIYNEIGNFPVRVNPLSTNIECVEKNGECDASFGTEMYKINPTASTIECKFNGLDDPWCDKAYNVLSSKNIDKLNNKTCPKGWQVANSAQNVCIPPIGKCANFESQNLNVRQCVGKSCIKVTNDNTLNLIQNCNARFNFKPNAVAIANSRGGIREKVDIKVKDTLGTSTNPISSNVDRFNFTKNGILVKVFEAVKSNNIIIKGPSIGDRNYGVGNTTYIVNNINFNRSSILLNTQFTQFVPDDSYKTEQVFVEFTGYIKMPLNTEKVIFQTECDQGSRFYLNLNNTREFINVIDSWSKPDKKQSGTFNVKPNQFIPFKLDYFLDTGLSTIVLSWKLNNDKNFTIISRDNFFLDKEQCNKITDIPAINTIIDTQFKTYPGVSGVGSFNNNMLKKNKIGDFDTADECAIVCNYDEDCKAFTYSSDKTCYKFDPTNPRFSKNEKTNSFIRNNTESIYGSYNNSLEVPMRKMLLINNFNNSIKLDGMNSVLKNDFTIEMWIKVTAMKEDINLFEIDEYDDVPGHKLIFKINKNNNKLEVDLGYPIVVERNEPTIESQLASQPASSSSQPSSSQPSSSQQSSSQQSSSQPSSSQQSSSQPSSSQPVSGPSSSSQSSSEPVGYSRGNSVEYFSDFETPDIFTNSWTHVAMSYTNNLIKIFVNGFQKSEIKQKPYTASSNSSIYIGNSDRYKLYVDEIRIWSKAINESTISSFMKMEVDNKHPNNNNLVWYSNLNFINNNQIYNKCIPLIGSGCIKDIKATFTEKPIIAISDSPFA